MRLKVKVKNPMWRYRATYARHLIIPEFNVYEGELKKKHKWAAQGEFMLLTNDPQCPTHIINQADVVEAWVQREKEIA